MRVLHCSRIFTFVSSCTVLGFPAFTTGFGSTFLVHCRWFLPFSFNSFLTVSHVPFLRFFCGLPRAGYGLWFTWLLYSSLITLISRRFWTLSHCCTFHAGSRVLAWTAPFWLHVLLDLTVSLCFWFPYCSYRVVLVHTTVHVLHTATLHRSMVFHVFIRSCLTWAITLH